MRFDTQPDAVLVHGAAGFVAASLLPLLVTCGYRRLVLFDRREIPVARVDRLRELGATVSCHLGDSLSGLRDLPRLHAVISLGGATDVDMALREPFSAFDANVRIALDLAEFLRTRPERTRAVYMSSDEVLGETWTPLPEDAPLKPTQPYAASKAAAEVILHNYRDVYGLDLITLRSCNLVGGQQRARKLIPVSVASLLASRPVPVYGTGEQKREWMAVEDLCVAIRRLVDPEVPAGVYHAASGVHLSVLEVVQVVADALGRPALRAHVADRPVHDACYSMSTARLQDWGWRIAVDPLQAIRVAARAMGSAEAKELVPT